jgi:hypothetical protein
MAMADAARRSKAWEPFSKLLESSSGPTRLEFQDFDDAA